MSRCPTGGERIDRTQPIHFTFDGQRVAAYAGDTVASALLAAGIHLVGRSFKLHRPRGIVGLGAEEPNALIEVGAGAWRQPNLRATQVEVQAGMAVRSQNRWPSLRFDANAALGGLHRFMPAGFYYKTFMWPSWHLFEPHIRKMAGLGRSPIEADPDRYAQRYAHCDVLVVGAGAAGIAAARAAAAGSARVMLVEQEPCVGVETGDTPQALAAAGIQLLTRACAFGHYDHNLVAVAEHLVGAVAERVRQRLWLIRAKRVVLATGALERPLVFPHNDRPGILLASAAAGYLQRYGVLAGQRALVFTNNDSAYSAALALRRAGAQVRVVDVRAASASGFQAQARDAGIAVDAPATLIDTFGGQRVTGALVASLDGRNARREPCDLLMMSGGWAPTVHLYSQAGGKLRFDGARSCFVPASCPQAVEVVGAANGDFGAAPLHIEPYWSVPEAIARGPQWVDFQNDVCSKDVAIAAREGYASVELLKRYTTMGMATDQGKTSNVNALALLAEQRGQTPGAVGTTTFRPPYTPVTLGLLSNRQLGELYAPRRLLPAAAEHAAAGARFLDYGAWQRPQVYPRPGEDVEAAVTREWQALRQGVVLFDGSPLGKIEVVGRDAGLFLDRMFVGNVSDLAVGRLRYGAMLSEHGIVIDDGVVARLSTERFLVGPSSAMAGRIMARFEEWLQCEWPDLDVAICDLTTAWASIAVAGPRARELLLQAGSSIDLSAQALPHMRYAEGEIAGIAARVQRVSFTGELQFEVSVPRSAGAALWRRLMQAGAGLAVTPIGLDAWLRARIEKGYAHVGTDTDGTTLPQDIGLKLPSSKACDFVGRRSLRRPGALRADRLQLVGLEGLDPTQRLPVGAHIVGDTGFTPPCVARGRVTSSCVSPVLQRSIALALLSAGRARGGQTVVLRHLGETWQAKVVAPTFYDPEGRRLHD